jgi:DNA topoisomerase-1
LSNSQGKRLVIVESPTKARTIRRFLPSDYQVEASMGHVRDLPASASEIPERYKGKAWARLGVKVDEDFKPLYVVTPKKRSVVNNLKSALKGASELYIATDEDREGESIGWHLVEVLKPKVPVKRMVFHEITKGEILNALEQTREIDDHLVEAQETRRVLDRLVGYTISPLLWKKIAPKLSAGRVQSVAVRLLVRREQERLRFRSASYWDLAATLSQGGATFEAKMTHLGDLRLASGRDFDADTGRLKDGLEPGRDLLLLGGEAATGLAERARGGAWSVAEIEERQATRRPSAPFTTSTLQQEASRKLSLSAKNTMRVAQTLYENGLITYMRTDSTNLSQEAIDGSRSAIVARYGQDYLSPPPRRFTKSSRNAQEAHEAIRPAGSEMKTAQEHNLKGNEARLYDLIWKRTVATQMADARLKFVTARIRVRTDSEEATFRATGRTVLFPGFFRAYVEGSDDPEAALDDRDQPLPPLAEGDTPACESVDPEGHETKPPARFTEASLVKLLEQEGIGRPSTYASIIDTIMARGYARKSGTQLVPSFTAFATNNLLEQQFANLVDTEFTATMETALDDIAAGSLEAGPYLRDFFSGERGIEGRVEQGLEGIDAREISEVHNANWDPYKVRVGRYGPYVEGEIDGERRTASLPEDAAPADLTLEELTALLKGAAEGDTVVGTFAETGEPMLLKSGRYGPYLQLGEGETSDKPKRISLPKGVAPDDVTAELATGLLSLPRTVGSHPESGETIEAHIGRYGPYVRHQRTFASLAADDDVLTVDLPRALELIASKARGRQAPLKVLGEHPESGDPIELLDGRYGPYVKHQKTNASLRKDQDVDQVTLEEALDLLAAREAAGPKKRRKGGRSGGRKRSGGSG